MKVTTKIKTIILLLNLFFVVCGMLFVGSFFNKKTNVSCKLNKKVDNTEIENRNLDVKNSILNELTECQNNLFKYQNEAERLKLLPDVRKDVINLLLSLHTMEKKIGQENNLSSDCIKIFALSARIPSLQEYTNKYRQQMFANNCIFLTNLDIIKLIVPFQIQFLENQKETEKQEQNSNKKWYQRWFDDIRYSIAKLFVKSQIKKSDLEIAIESSNYKQAKKILEDIKNIQTQNKIDKQTEKDAYLLKIYNAVTNLNDLKQMINNIYLILEEKN